MCNPASWRVRGRDKLSLGESRKRGHWSRECEGKRNEAKKKTASDRVKESKGGFSQTARLRQESQKEEAHYNPP